jgi:uncharacterized protein DUF669
MEFNFFTEEDFVEKESDNLLEPGDVAFTIIHAEEKHSKAGNPMIELQLETIDSNDKKRIVYDMIVFKDNMKWKIKAILFSIRNEEEVKNTLLSGKLYTTDLVGYSGKGTVIIDEYINSNQRTTKRMKFDRYYPLNNDEKSNSDNIFFEDNLDDIQF